MVVYGHTPVPEAEWLNNTICLDTGCVFGGKLTALRYPERELVSVPAHRMYYEPVRPLQAAKTQPLSAQQELDDLLDLDDVTGKRLIETRLRGAVTIREENSIAALEIMSRFAANPKWLIYLPPTMSPSEASRKDSYLEYPTEALDYYRAAGVESVVCEEKHMGSRAIVVVCQDEMAAVRRFGVQGEGRGIIYTRTGRRFFADDLLQHAVLERLATALDRASLWDRFQTDWFCLDCELLPWSVKAEDLLRTQYAPTGAAARAAVEAVRDSLRQASSRGLGVSELGHAFDNRAMLVNQYVDAYRNYCWPVNSIDDIKLAPFHVLASEGAVHVDKTHVWHMETLGELCRSDPALLLETPFRTARLEDAEATNALVNWWET
jgi:protein phosphatase